MFEESKITLKEYQDEFEIYKNSITICEIADKEASKRLRINPGDKYTTIRQPQTKEEAFERLKKYDAKKLFFALVENFNDKYSLNNKTLKDELDTINQFIENAEKIKIDEAVNIYNKNFNPSKSYENEYIKLKYGHYENKYYSGYYSFFDNITSFIKAKYFFYKDWLENEIKNIEIETKPKKLQQFFKAGTDLEIITALQSKYKDYKGKKMAYLIYILHKEFNLIDYSLRDINKSRKRFVIEFSGKEFKNIESTNKLFNPNNVTLKNGNEFKGNKPTYEQDPDYITIRTEIQNILIPIK